MSQLLKCVPFLITNNLLLDIQVKENNLISDMHKVDQKQSLILVFFIWLWTNIKLCFFFKFDIFIFVKLHDLIRPINILAILDSGIMYVISMHTN